MNPNQTLLAHANTYDLFSQLYQNGIDDTTLPFIQAIPELQNTLPDDLTPDTLAAQHYDLFGLNVFPHASAYLDPELNLGGSIALHLQQVYHSSRFTASTQDNLDHLSVELDFLAHLCRQEQGEEIQEIITSFFVDHFLIWLPIFVDAILRQADPFYSALAQLTLNFSLEHAAQLNRIEHTFLSQIPQPQDLSQDSSTDLKRISVYLTTPIDCGFFLSKEDISDLGRELKVPRGFGSRQQIMTNLLRSAADYDKLANVFEQIQRTAGQTSSFLTSLSEADSQIQPILKFWQDRIHQTRATLDQFQNSIPQV